MKSLKKIFICLLVLFAVSQTVYAKGTVKYVSSSNAVLREKASTSSKKAFIVSYASSVEVLQEKGKWSYVQLSSDSSKKGWITTNQLTKKKLSATSKVSANAKEIALAGKGFSKNLELNLTKGFSYDFSLVNKVEKFSVSEQEVIAFMKEGKLEVGE